MKTGEKIALRLAPTLLTGLMTTLKFRITNEFPYDKNAVFIFWHGKMLGGWYALRKRRAGALVSRSKDGELLAALLSKWNYTLFRGSSSAGGKEALSELSAFAGKGNSAVITPDGPRGPSGYIKNGPLIIAMERNIPVVPVRVEYSSVRKFDRSWDDFELPLPFSECKVTFGKPAFYRIRLDGPALDDFKEDLAKEM